MKKKENHSDHPLLFRLEKVFEKNYKSLLGTEAENWEIELEIPDQSYLRRYLPQGSLIFGNNGAGDHLFLDPKSSNVKVFWHEGSLIEDYSKNVEELFPDRVLPPSNVPPIYYFDGKELVKLGDKVQVRYLLFFKEIGKVVYLPGVSKKTPNMEYDGFMMVGIKIPSGRVDCPVMEDSSLKKGVQLISRSVS